MTVPPKVFVVRESAKGVATLLVMVPPFVNVVPVPLKVKVFASIANVPPDVVVSVPLTVIAAAAVIVPAELLILRFA